MKGKTEKILSIFLSILIVSMSFSIAFSFSSEKVEAQEQWVCCVMPDGDCNDDVIRSECISQGGRPFTGACSNVPECKIGTCIPKVTNLAINELFVSGCQYNKHRAECEAIRGAFSPEMPPLCEKGCCQIPNTEVGRVCTTLPLFVCKELANRDGGNYEFEPGKIGESCYNVCGADKEGCCVVGGGECVYQTRGECSSPSFFEGRFCSEIGSPNCIVEAQARTGCCNPINLQSGEIDRAICWFDSAGNQEEVVEECSYPESKCEICVEEECTDYNKNLIDFGKPYCKDRSCYLEGSLGSQAIRVNDEGEPALESIDSITEMLHGQSLCYNFFTHYGETGLEFYEKSTGLQSQILRCVEGEVEIHQLGTDREEFCEQINPVNVKTFENNWEACRQCANKSGFWNTLGDAFLAVPKGGWRLVFLLQFTGPHCTQEECEAIGEIKVDGLTKQMCWYNYDAGKLEGIGSCDPIYSPGTTTQCTECGSGFDWIYNVCDEPECYSLGNCQWEKITGWKAVGHYFSRFIPAFLATRISVVPTVDCVTEATWRCWGPQFPACFPGAYATCLLDRTKYVNPICWGSAIIGSAFDGVASSKWLGSISLIASLMPGVPWYARAGLGVFGIFSSTKDSGNGGEE